MSSPKRPLVAVGYGPRCVPVMQLTEAAASYSILTVALAGSNIVVAPQLYGATFTYFAHVLPTLGIEARFASDDRADSIAALIDERTCAVFCESVGNPAGNVVDRRSGGGRGPPSGRAADRGQHGRYPDDAQACPSWCRRGGALADQIRGWPRHDPRRRHRRRRYISVERARRAVSHVQSTGAGFPQRGLCPGLPRASVRGAGPFHPTSQCGRHPLSFNSFLPLQGLETMAVRLERHEANARAIAAYLAADPHVEWVNFAGFADNPYHELVQRYLKVRVPSIITFGVVGGYDAGLAFFDSLELFKRLLNLGDAKSLFIHSASTTHRRLSEEELYAAGIRPETIRLSIGVEHVDDLIDDIDQALTKATAGPPPESSST